MTTLTDDQAAELPEPADFYQGRGPDAVYLGTVAAGAPEDIEAWERFQSLTDENYTAQDFREEVADLREQPRTGDLTKPGAPPTWNWGYASSSDTPWAYVFDAGTVYVYRYGVEMAAIRCNYTRPGPNGTREPRRPQSHTSPFPVLQPAGVQ